MVTRVAVIGKRRELAIVHDGRPVHEYIRRLDSQKIQDAVLKLADDAFPVTSYSLYSAVQCLNVELPELVVLADLRTVEPFARSRHAEVIAQLVGEHAAYQYVQGDASVLVPADDGRQIKTFVEIIDHKHRADRE